MTCPTKRLALPGILALLVLATGPAQAGQHCVTCNSPDATYLCEAQNGPGILAANGGQLACITELAKRGGHDQCSVIKRAASQCEGLAPTVLYPGASDADFNAAINPPPPAGTDVAPPPPPPARADVPPTAPDGVATSATDTFTPDDERDPLQPQNKEPTPGKPPKTVAEMADRAYESTKKSVGKTGKAVGDTAKSAGNAISKTAKKTGEQIGKAGKAVGSAAKKTWNCVTSLFSDC